MKNKTFLAIIPARGGSKRLPNKNILDLNGKPLINYTIDEAVKSNYLDEIVVSSDSKKILNIANKSNITSLERPKKFSTDKSSSFDVVKHTIQYYKKLKKEFDYIVLLQPTSPLRDVSDIDNAIKLLFKQKAKAVVSISKVSHSPLWSFKAKKNKNLDKIFNNKFIKQRSQDLPQFYTLNGAVYICKTSTLLKEGSFLISKNIFGYEMKKENSIDIDEKIDFELAKIILKEKQYGN